MAAHTPAVTAVLETVELLEDILVRLDFKTLLLCQRVSRKFRDVVNDSNKLQTKLFLKPANSISEAEALGMPNEPQWILSGGEGCTTGQGPIALLNTNIVKVLISEYFGSGPGIALSRRLLPTLSTMRWQASAGRMYISQPPVAITEITSTLGKYLGGMGRGDDDYQGRIYSVYLTEMQLPLLAVMDEAEEQVFAEFQYSVNWQTARLVLPKNSVLRRASLRNHARLDEQQSVGCPWAAQNLRGPACHRSS